MNFNELCPCCENNKKELNLENEGKKINILYAFLSEDKDGIEGIVAEKMGDSWMPFVFSDFKIAQGLMEHSKNIAVFSDTTIRLVKFTAREVIDTIQK